MPWRNYLNAVYLAAALLLLGGCKEERVSVGAKAPALAAYDLAGRQADLSRWAGKNVYLNFWSSGCGGCLAEMGTLEKLSKAYGDKVVVVAVNTDADGVALSPLLARRHISYPVVRDQLGITRERYQVVGTPTSFVIDRHGKVVELHQGVRNEQQLLALFRQLASEA